MLMLIWHRHRVLPFVSGSKVQKADAPKSPHCDSIVAICHAYGLRTVDISVTRLKWLQGKRQSLVAFSAQKKPTCSRLSETPGLKNLMLDFWRIERAGDRSPGINPASRLDFLSKNSRSAVFFLGAENREQLRWQDLEDISLQISGAQCQLATCMDSTSPSTFRSSCLLSLWDDQLLGEIWKRGIFIG